MPNPKQFNWKDIIEMPKKYTKETLQNKLFDMGFNISVIGEYVDCYTKIELNCNKHNIRFFQRPIDVV